MLQKVMGDSHQGVLGYYIESINGKEILVEVKNRDQMPETIIEREESDLAILPNITQRKTLDNLLKSDSRTNPHKYALTVQEYFDNKQNINNQVKVKNRIRIPQHEMKPPPEYLLDESDMVESETSDDSYESDCTETEESPTDSRTNVQFPYEDHFNNKINIRKGLRIPEHETDTNPECLLDKTGRVELPNITVSGTLDNLKESDSTKTEENLTDSRTNVQFTLEDNYEINTNNQVRIPQPEVEKDPGYPLDESDNSHESDSIETEENLTDSRTNLLEESDLAKVPIITQRKALDNSHESYCISGKIFSQRDESNKISEEEFLNNLVLQFVQRYENGARAKGHKISTTESESTSENASSADEGLMNMEEDFVTKINEYMKYLENFVDGTEFNNEIDTMQCVATNKDISEGKCQVEGYNVETNEAIQGILQSSEENYQCKKYEKEIYTIGKKGCVEDTEDAPNVGKVAVHQISAGANDYIIKEIEQDLCLITKGKETGEKTAEETDKMEIDEKHVEENYLQENLPVVMELVEGKVKMYSILYKSPWEIAYLHDEEINISKVLCVKLSKNCGTRKLKHFKAFILAQKDGQEKVYNILDSKKQKKISAHKANEAIIKKNKKSKKKNMLWIMKKLFGSSENKNKLKIKRLPSIKEQLGIGNLVDYFIEEQISKLCSDSHRASKFEYIYKQEYKPEDYPKAEKHIYVWHEIIGKQEGKKCLERSVLKPDFSFMREIERGAGNLKRKCQASNLQKALVLPERAKVGPPKNPKKLSVLEQVLKDLKEKELLEKHGISVHVFSEEKGLLSRDENVKNKNNKLKVASKQRKKESTNSDNSSNQNLSQMHKLKLIINKVMEEKRKLLQEKHNCSTMSNNNKSRQNKGALVKKSEVLLKNENQSKDINEKRPVKGSREVFEIRKKYFVTMQSGNKIIIRADNTELETTEEHSKNRKAVKEATDGRAINEIGSAQHSEQPKTAIKHQNKRKAYEKATGRKKSKKKREDAVFYLSERQLKNMQKKSGERK